MQQQNRPNDSLTVIQSCDVAVLAKFGREGCPPCLCVQPVLEKLLLDFAGDLRVIEVDTRDPGNQSLVDTYTYGRVPQFHIFIDGAVVASKQGFESYDDFRGWLDGALRAAGRPVPEETAKETEFREIAVELWRQYEAVPSKLDPGAVADYSDTIQKANDDRTAERVTSDEYAALCRQAVSAYGQRMKPHESALHQAYDAYTVGLRMAVEHYLNKTSDSQRVASAASVCDIGDPHCRS